MHLIEEEIKHVQKAIHKTIEPNKAVLDQLNAELYVELKIMKNKKN